VGLKPGHPGRYGGCHRTVLVLLGGFSINRFELAVCDSTEIMVAKLSRANWTRNITIQIQKYPFLTDFEPRALGARFLYRISL
jgi:hypothetical protein